jgi:hypothetical protein
MDLLVTEARENSGRQFVFLTPLGLEKQQLNNMDDLSIFRFVICCPKLVNSFSITSLPTLQNG